MGESDVGLGYGGYCRIGLKRLYGWMKRRDKPTNQTAQGNGEW